ncbi:GNAT family N-acetyltransferase [Nodosilinea sp. P-1105]|uniref:GNAT family N-acetyltransferase n=1 Tax=Nodosilinea sp. P-1105 TaxID=2546229 RepID=UPI00146CC45D|nr:N-acetyltransferase [Nodosilinea sp. P-1105]
MRIEPYTPDYLDAVVRLSLRAWAPVFDSIQNALDADLFHAFYADGWRISQEKAVTEVCAADDTTVWVAIDGATVVGFIAVKLTVEDSMGEIYMVAVDPEAQGRGIGSQLIEFALNWMKQAGITMGSAF